MIIVIIQYLLSKDVTNMNEMIPGLVMGLREGLEAFLLISIVLQYLAKSEQSHLKSKVVQGVTAGVIISAILGVALYQLADNLGGVDSLTKVWESIASFVALGLVTTFIIWMIRHSSDMASHVKKEVAANLSPIGLFLISLVIIAREGTEIAVFTFAGKYPASSVALGILAALIITVLVFKSLIKINLSLLFKITLAYLILQAGYLLGYAFHEGLSSMKGYGIISAESPLFIKVFDLSKTALSHKDGFIGIPLHVTLGWYSKPEWLQLFIQYFYTITMFMYWNMQNEKRSAKPVDKR